MSNVTPFNFGPTDKHVEPVFEGIPADTWQLTYKDADGTKGVETITGVLKFNPPFLVVVPVDKPESHMHEGNFMVMLSDLNNVKKIQTQQTA